MRTRKRRKQHLHMPGLEQHHHDHRPRAERHLERPNLQELLRLLLDERPTTTIRIINNFEKHKTSSSSLPGLSSNCEKTEHSPIVRYYRMNTNAEKHDTSEMPASSYVHYAIEPTDRKKLNYRPHTFQLCNKLLRKSTILALIATFVWQSFIFIATNFYHEQQQNPPASMGVQGIKLSKLQNPFLPPSLLPSNAPTSLLVNIPDIISQQGGIIKDKNVTLVKQYNPIRISKDIIIKKDARLTIESGVEMLFEKKKGIIVYGTLEILGAPNDRVRLNLLKSTTSATVNLRSQNNQGYLITRQLVRLVDGDLPNEGRVQIKFNDRWHSLCTNSKNLTAADIRVICQQVGYQDGNFYKWFIKRNETATSILPQIMSKSFHCDGTETAITQCKRWNRVRAGGGICDGQSDIGIRCSRKLVFHENSNMPSYEFWRGIEFVNSETYNEYVLDGQMKRKVSKSILEHMTVEESGLNHVGNATAAIRVLGQPPRMSNLEIRNSIYGIMVEDADDAIQMNDIRLNNIMSCPLFINSSWGKISLDNMHVENNGGDGVRIARHERIRVGSHDFCKFANLGSSQSFPVILSHEQTFFTAGQDCCQEFISNNQLTVQFPVLRSTPNNLLPESDKNRRVSIPAGISIGKDANLVIYDDYRDEFPFRLRIQNGTRAQSIVSKSGRLKICYEPAIFRTVLFTIEVVADLDDEWSGRARDVEISNSLIKSNEGRGIWIENQRSGVKLFNTTIVNHNYLSGFHSENGTGEVIIQASTIANNSGHGVFINLAGGYYHIDNSSITDNSLKGVALEYDKRPELAPFNHTFHLGFSLIARNGENGLFLGNVCRSDAFWNISMNSFVANGEDAIFFQTCLPTPDLLMNFKKQTSRVNITDSDMLSGYQDLLITHNVFRSNIRRAVNLSPLFFVRASILHNLFRDHPLAVLQISNQVDRFVDTEVISLAPVSVQVVSNRFYSNTGRYVVNIGVIEDSSRQSMTFTKNILEDNYMSEPYSELRPRSRVSAVVVVSSSNTKLVRNRFNNPLSAFEMGSHLEQHSKIINATTNFWGRGLDAASIYRRIFDRKNRYNLAQIEFLQYLMSPEDLEFASDLSFDRERDKISTFKNGSRLGGEVKGWEELEPDTYIVQDDIYVRPGAHLILKPNTVLKFQDGVGMMVQGRLDALGKQSAQIVLTSLTPASRAPHRMQVSSATTTTPVPFANAWVSHQPEAAVEFGDSQETFATATNITFDRLKRIKRQPLAGQNVRLSHTTMGRLEVQIDGTWGSVCDYNFDIEDAAVVCQQLGMILNRDDWLLQKFQYAANDHQQASMMVNNVLMTNIRCDPSLDTDLTRCKSEISLRGDFDGLCNSEVGIRCFPPSWSGVRLGMAAEVSTLEHVTIQRAGMFDYAAHLLKPALQIDFNRHWISSLVVKSSSDSGIGILWNDVIGRHSSELSITDSKFINNERHGIELRSRGLSFKNILISNNRRHGLDYSPTFSQRELDDLLSWLTTPKNSDHIVKLSFPPHSSKYFSIASSEDSYKFFVIPQYPQPDLKETFTIGTDPGHMLSIHLLNPIHPDSSETLNMSIGTNPESPIWDLRVNMTTFPMVSPGYKFHFNYTSGKKPRGNILIYVRSRYNNRDLKILTRYIPSHLVMTKFDQTAININSKLINSIVIYNSTITKNGIGLKFRHPNYPFDSTGQYNLRYANETTNITNNVFEGNHFSCIFLSSDEYGSGIDLLQSNRTIATSEIRYHLVGNKLRKSVDGIRQFSRDIRYTSNVYHWSINDTVFEQNKGGGINLVLPYFWPYDANLSHTVEIHNNSFFRNHQFEVAIGGHFVDMNMTRNTFRENRCKNSLIYFSGMEKKILIRHNLIELNTCSRIMEFDIQSHADKLGSVTAYLEYNALRRNRRLPPSNATAYYNMMNSLRQPKLMAKLHPQASDFALSMKGLQPLNITRNLFANPELRFELVVGIIMDPNERTVNAIENYWGTTLPSEISDRILDFDDWNSFAIAEISPYLTQDSFTAASMIAEPRDLMPQYQRQTNSRSLGGRLTKSVVLPWRKEPYLVESDFTIMPGVRLTIEKGVVLEFMPYIGMLVLGDLIAAGTRDKPIQMRPALSASDIAPLHGYLLPEKVRPSMIQPNLNDPLSYEHNYAFRHYQFAYPIDMGSVRLCKNEICNDGLHTYENNIEDKTLRQEVLKSSNNTWKIDGFLEIFNMTSLQWIPVCDPLFTEHTARVVCRQLGYSHLSILKRGRRYTIEQEQISSIKSWPESVRCAGDESSLANCPLIPLGYQNHSTSCTREGSQFVYVYCGDYPETMGGNSQQLLHSSTIEHANHWGGIRFSCPSNLNTNLAQEFRDSLNLINQNPISSYPATRSRLQYVVVDRAGMLHREKSPAVQVLQCNVQVEYIVISNSAHHGLEMITSQGNQNLHQLRIKNSLGVGLNYLSLTGSSSASKLVPYLPLKHMDISSDIFGLVDVCGANKEIQVEDRLLLFYRYSSQAVDCIKIISSKLNIKHVGVRMLRFDLFNSTAYTSRPDHIRIYDGDIFDRDSRLLVELGVTEKHRTDRPELKFYQTTDSKMTIRVHVSGASRMYGFIAEIVTTPVSYNIQRDTYNNITYSEITNNKMGALTISSAGESSPNLILKNNRFDTNCMHLFGNFTSCASSVYMELQNCQKLRFINNLIKSNQGGLTIKSYSHSAVSALEAIIENNVFEANSNTNTLALIGPKTDPYQIVRILKNYFTRNYANYRSNILLAQVVANVSQNVVSSNTGKHQIEVIGFDKLPLSYQTFMNNWIYNNSATLERDRSTIFSNSAGQQFMNNYLVNPDNHFEISTMNWSRYDVKPFYTPRDDEMIHLTSGDGSSRDLIRKTVDSIPFNIIDTKKVDLYHATIDAKSNWWGFSAGSAIQGRIRDRAQHEELLKVEFLPYLESNGSLLSGVCSGGWTRVGDSCLIYIGSKMNSHEAKEFCDRERATIPLIVRANHEKFSDFIKSQDPEYDVRIDRVWIRSFSVSEDACPALNDHRTKIYDCQDKNSFLCEKDPMVVVSLWHWHREIGSLVLFFIVLPLSFLSFCCSACWILKCRERHKEKLERKNSIRSSTMRKHSSNNSLRDFVFNSSAYYPPEKSSITDLSLSTQLTQHSNEGIDLIRPKPLPVTPSKRTSISSNKTQLSWKHDEIQSHTYVNLKQVSKPQRKEIQPSMNPAYTRTARRPSPPPPPPPLAFPSAASLRSASASSVRDGPQSKPPTPAPSFLEIHPRALSTGSRTPSYSGSQNDEITMDPISQSNPRGPILAPTYSQIRHPVVSQQFDPVYLSSPPERQSRTEEQQRPLLPPEESRYKSPRRQTDARQPMNQTQYRQVDTQDSTSPSTIPTLYSTEVETFEESSHSYIEAYNNTYNRGFDQKMNNDETSYTLTERSSTTDLLMNYTSQLSPPIDKFYNQVVNPNLNTFGQPRDSNAQSRATATTNLINMKPQSSSDYVVNTNTGNDSFQQPETYLHQTTTLLPQANSQHILRPTQRQPPYPRALSERTGSLGGVSQFNQYCVETSLDDLEAPTATVSMAPDPTFGGSQRLSPVSASSYGAPSSDSKLGSRVFLQTNF